MLWWLEIRFRIDVIDRRVVTDRAAEIPVIRRRHAAFAEDDRSNDNYDNNRARSDANTNIELVGRREHDRIALSISVLKQQKKNNDDDG